MSRAPTQKKGTILKTKLLRAAALVAASSLALSSWAGVFSVTPVRIFMLPQDRAVAVTVTNEGDQELVMQADIYTWKQKADGSDDLALSEDLILAPPILKIPAHGRQVVRLARLGAPPSGAQATYRMIMREIPEAHAADKKVQLQIALAFSLPVFITPRTAKRDLECSVSRTAPDAVTARCENRGNAYAQPREVVLSANGAKVAGMESAAYLLPGTRHAYEIKRAEGPIPAGPAKLAVNFDDGTSQAFDVTVGD